MIEVPLYCKDRPGAPWNPSQEVRVRYATFALLATGVPRS